MYTTIPPPPHEDFEDFGTLDSHIFKYYIPVLFLYMYVEIYRTEKKLYNIRVFNDNIPKNPCFFIMIWFMISKIPQTILMNG